MGTHLQKPRAFDKIKAAFDWIIAPIASHSWAITMTLLKTVRKPEMGEMNRFLPAVTVCMALAGAVNAAEVPWQEDSSPKFASPELSRDAQRALICQTVTDWAAYQVTKLIRDDARENQAISPEGMQILRQIRLTEGLASAAFDILAPRADHESMYKDAVSRMQAYLKEDPDGADANTQQLVPACQQTYTQMAAAGELTSQQVQLAKDASRESLAELTRELQGSPSSH